MQSSIFSEIRDFFARGSVLSRLIGINLAIFVLVGIIRVLFFLFDAPSAYNGIINWFGVPSNTDTLLTRPWTLFTYMFLHFDLFHIFFNMFMLYIGGRLFREFLGENRMTGTYLIGGLVGAMFFILAYNFFPVFSQDKHLAVAIGASASVLAIFIAAATYMPNYELPLIILGRIRLKYIAIFFVVIDLLSIDKGNSGGHLAHLGGALWGFVYVMLLKSGKDPGKFVSMWVRAIGTIFNPKPKMRVEYRSKKPVSDEEYNRHRVENQKRMDHILDKISKHGYQSLSSEEKEILFRMSNKD
ncbi:MAG: rhomboid family intramembrane serine protease [Bacteroidetes bacterium]|nr:MAG: rhomboid family intramembrane serine protease [Bacteroidota bacterium]